MGDFLLAYTPIKDEQLQGPAVMRYSGRGGRGASLHLTWLGFQRGNFSRMERSSNDKFSAGQTVSCWLLTNVGHTLLFYDFKIYH